MLLQSLVGPIAAFFTFIGSMGNIPLAAVLFSNGVSFAGIMAFIFSDLVVFPVLRIQASYYGWKMALYILGIFMVILVFTSLIMHYGFSFLDLLPDPASAKKINDREFFKYDYTFFMNIIFLCATAAALIFSRKKKNQKMKSKSATERLLFWNAMIAYTWLGIGLLLHILSLLGLKWPF